MNDSRLSIESFRPTIPAAYPFPLFSMTSSIRLPDAMPDVSRPTLLVVCDTHHCRLLDVGGHVIVEKAELASREHEFTDRQDRKPGPSAHGGQGGSMMGVGETDQLEEHRLKEFANTLVKHLEELVRSQKIDALHLSAPGKFLAAVKKDLTAELKKVTVQTLDGNYVKEPPLALLVRFRPDLKEAVEKLRSEENYSPKNQPPKK